MPTPASQIAWQTRGDGARAHRFHRLTAAQVAAVLVPSVAGVCELDIDGERVFGLAVPSPALRGRPLRLSPVVYATAADAEAHAEAWLTRDRDVFYASNP